MLLRLKDVRSDRNSSYQLWIALKTHLDPKSNYDALKYNFKVKVRQIPPNVTYFVDKLVRTYPNHYDLCEFMVANLLAENDWVGSLREEHYLEKRAYLDAFPYRLKSEISSLNLQNTSLQKFLSYDPKVSFYACPILDFHASGKISTETVAVINNLTHFCDHIRKSTEDPLGMLKGHTNQIIKYGKLLTDRVDHKKIKDILLFEFTP